MAAVCQMGPNRKHPKVYVHMHTNRLVLRQAGSTGGFCDGSAKPDRFLRLFWILAIPSVPQVSPLDLSRT